MADIETGSGNRGALLTVALTLFSRKGYDAVGVQEIAEAAKVTKPTLYHYFGSKRGLLDAIVREYGSDLFQLIKNASTYANDVANGLTAIATAMVRFADVHPDFYRLQLAMYFSPPESEPNDAVRSLHDGIYGLVEAFFKKAAEDHGNMKARHAPYAAAFIGLINTYIGMSLNRLASINDQVMRKAVHQFMHGIFS